MAGHFYQYVLLMRLVTKEVEEYVLQSLNFVNSVILVGLLVFLLLSTDDSKLVI